ncbi:MAG: SEC-C metal-binding domain-containing protein [Chlamydiae bacterium]|nr:SEC-C metal-binding domain-containing protein [Chlamydiota bacterium]
MSKPGRNDPCSCGSGEKFKKCCEKKIGLKKIQAHLISDPSKGSANETMKISQSFFQKIVPSNPTLEHKNIQKKDAEG